MMSEEMDAFVHITS